VRRIRIHSYIIAAALIVATAVTVADDGSPPMVSRSLEGVVQAGLASHAPNSSAPSTQSWMGTLEGMHATPMSTGGESAAAPSAPNLIETVAAKIPAVSALPSPILEVHPEIGPVAAPIMRFRDGGHAYYLYGKGLHSCTYIGKCMDLFAPIGEPLFAMADGTVSVPPYAANSYGHHLIITFRNGTKAIYAHLTKISVKPGPVAAGSPLGTVGCSGTSGESNACAISEAHLHLEWSGLKWSPGQYGELPPAFKKWRGTPARCYEGCG
jgi:hypothetical protein